MINPYKINGTKLKKGQKTILKVLSIWWAPNNQKYNLHFKAIHNGLRIHWCPMFCAFDFMVGNAWLRIVAFSIFYRFAITIAISGHETSQSNQHFCWGFFLFVLARKQTVKNDLSIEFHTVNRYTGSEIPLTEIQTMGEINLIIYLKREICVDQVNAIWFVRFYFLCNCGR